MTTDTAPRARTFRHLLLDSGIDTLTALADRTKIWPQQLSYLMGGWLGTPELRKKVAKAFGVSEAELVQALLATGAEVARKHGFAS